MQDIGGALVSLLLADGTVSGLVGGVRIHPAKVPQGQKQPSVVYNAIHEESDYNMQGGSGLGRVDLQVDAWALTPDLAATLANAVFDALSGFAGVSNGVTIQGTFLNNGRTDYDQTAELHRSSRIYRIYFSET